MTSLNFIQRLSSRGELVLVAVLCFSYFLVSSLAALALGMRRVELTTGRVLRGLVVELLILGAVAAILRLRGWKPERLGLRFSWQAAIAGVPLCMVYMAVYIGTMSIATAIAPRGALEAYSVVPKAPTLLILAFIVVSSVFEELTVSAYLIEALSGKGAMVAGGASVLLRLAYHLHQGPLAWISVLPLGVIFAAVYWRWRNVWPLMVAHTLANLFAFGSTRD